MMNGRGRLVFLMRIKVGSWHMIRPSRIGRGSALINGAVLVAFSTLLERKSEADD